MRIRSVLCEEMSCIMIACDIDRNSLVRAFRPVIGARD